MYSNLYLKEEKREKNTIMYYINYFFKINKKNTLAVLLLKTLTTLLFCVETIIIAHLIDNIADRITGSSKPLLQGVLMLAAFYLFKSALVYVEGVFWTKLKRAAETEISSYLFEKKKRLSYRTLEETENQELFQRIGTDTAEKFCDYFENSISLLAILLEIVGIFALVAVQNIWIAFVLLVVLFPYIIYSVRNGRHSYEAYEESEELFRRADYYQSVLTDRKYVEERTLFGYSDYFNRRWAKKFGEAVEIERKANLKIFAATESINIFATFVIGMEAFLLLLLVWKEAMTVGFFISIQKSFLHFIDQISGKFAGKMSDYEKGRMYAQDFERFTALEEEDCGGQNMESKKINGITLRNVSFCYPGSDRKIFDNLSYEFEGGKEYAIVGENGAGKSTLLRLLMGFYDNYEGEILIDGTDIRKLKKEELRNCFAYVPQEITHYEVQLEEYLKTQNREKIADVFEKLGVDWFDGKEENVLLGRIEESGTELSGGQWQLVAIARAMLENSSIYVLDEPTAAIDPIREAELYRIFQTVMKNQFTILVTHRLGAAKIADEILVLKDGKVCECGTHESLLAFSGIYAQMYQTQRGWYEQNEK